MCVWVCAQPSQTAPWYLIGIKNRCMCLWQFTQSVFLSYRQTPYCYCLAQRVTERDKARMTQGERENGTWRENDAGVNLGKQRHMEGMKTEYRVKKRNGKNYKVCVGDAAKLPLSRAAKVNKWIMWRRLSLSKNMNTLILFFISSHWWLILYPILYIYPYPFINSSLTCLMADLIHCSKENFSYYSCFVFFFQNQKDKQHQEGSFSQLSKPKTVGIGGVELSWSIKDPFIWDDS